MKIWLNNQLVNQDLAKIAVNDRGFTLGDGLYETIALRDGVALRLASHLARLRAGCEVLNLAYPATLLPVALQEVAHSNDLKDAILRLTLTRGAAARGLLPVDVGAPTLVIAPAPLPSVPDQPVRCIISSITRRNEHSPLSRIKSTNCLDSILARQEAAEQGADDAILLNSVGYIAEATSANLFIVRNGETLTPPVSDGALPGVMRAEVMAQRQVREVSLTPDDLREADEIFLTNSLGARKAVLA